MPSLTVQVASRIRDLREERGWSQEQLAEIAHLSRDAVSRIERGDRGPRLETVEQLINALNVPVTRFFDFGREPAAPRESAAEQRLGQLGRLLKRVDADQAERIVKAVTLLSETPRLKLVQSSEGESKLRRKPGRPRKKSA
jgi:transcriptional regulator with XRE-family HTH domain